MKTRDYSVQTVGNQTGYDLWSDSYDHYPNPTVTVDELNFPALYREIRNQDVLEIGSGTGRHTTRLLDQNNRVVAVDLSAGMLAVAKKKLSDHPNQNVEFIHGDVRTVDFGLRQFSCVVCSLVIEHISDVHSFFQRVSKLLRRDGKFYCSELHPSRTEQGIVAHFKVSPSVEIQLESTAHTLDTLRSAMTNANLYIESEHHVLGDNKLGTINPRWERFNGTVMLLMISARKT